jgi:hypothetical protein
MNSRLALLSAVATGALAGCSTQTSAFRREPYVKPALIMLTADQAQRRGIQVQAPAPRPDEVLPADAEPLDASAVTAPEDIKVYSMNRTVDPADRELMHEEHVVYRRETTPAWRLHASAERKILVGPRVPDGRQDLQPVLSKELISFMNDQRRAAESNQKAITALFQAVDALNRQQEALARRETPAAPDEASGETPAQSGSKDAPAKSRSEDK